MTAKSSQGGRGSGAVPSPSPVVTGGTPNSYEPSHVIQCLIELQREVSALATKTDRLITDVEKLDGRVHGVQRKLSWAEGFGIAAIVLIPAAAGIIWWLVGTQLTDIKNRLYALPSPPAASSSAIAPPAANSPSKPG